MARTTGFSAGYSSVTALSVFALFLVFVLLSFSCVFGQSPTREYWPGWKGLTRDNVSPSTGLIDRWPQSGPKLLWKADGLGNGYSNLAFFGNLIYTLGDRDGHSNVIALNRADGKVVWATPMGAPAGGSGFPGTRGTPSTDGRLVFGINQFADLLCVTADTGKKVWSKNLLTDFNGSINKSQQGSHEWGYAESPLVYRNLLICTPGGDQGAVVALEKKTGKLVWRSTNLKDDCTYASTAVRTIEGVKQIVVLTHKAVSGLDPDSGALLWSAPYGTFGITCTDPVVVGNYVYVTNAYGQGGFGFKVVKDAAGHFSAQQIYSDRQLENKHHGLIVNGKFVYSSTERRQLVCFNIETGEIAWTKDRMNGGKTALHAADGNLIARGENGTITLVELNSERYVEKGAFEQPDRTDCNAWTYPVVFEGKLYIRDQNQLFCYELKNQN